jgi:hypothetical protein
MLGHFRQALAARRRLFRRLPERVDWLDGVPAGVLAYRRGVLTVACNFTDRPARLPLAGRLLMGSDPLVRPARRQLHLPANSAAWLAAGTS